MKNTIKTLLAMYAVMKLASACSHTAQDYIREIEERAVQEAAQEDAQALAKHVLYEGDKAFIIQAAWQYSNGETQERPLAANRVRMQINGKEVVIEARERFDNDSLGLELMFVDDGKSLADFEGDGQLDYLSQDLKRVTNQDALRQAQTDYRSLVRSAVDKLGLRSQNNQQRYNHRGQR